MTQVFNRVSLALAISLFTTPYAMAGPLNTMEDVGKAIQSCWSAPQGVQKSSVTLRFSFKRDGSLLGQPRAAAISIQGNDQARKSFVDAAMAAVTHCTPLSLSPALAQGIGGQIFTMQFASPETCGSNCTAKTALQPD
ncbi:hypothetical protein HB779_10230 [Phyllobacterium sp. 628]|uniref:hypothetical protein n=1 Tax=Phyllobacterium sp. 628 TaxID=2718938 RepID=UPI00166283B8|nr:hypothetical protein [Phyllobacterium sp. 628]QND52245.1 hypothetical protein HB779_10230 [Phyllobacterium sp. 628]